MQIMHSFVGNFLDRHAYRWSLLYPLAFVGGIAFYLTAPLEPSWLILLCIATAIFGLNLRVKKSKSNVVRILFLNLAIFCVGFTFIKLKTDFTKVTFIEHQIGPVWLEGKLESIEGGSKGNRLLIRVGAISDLPSKDTPDFVRVTQKKDSLLLPGRELGCLVFLSPPPSPILPGDFNFKRKAFYGNLGGVGFTLGQCKPIAWSMVRDQGYLDNFQYGLDAVRHSLAVHIYKLLGEKSGGMAAAMITGEKTLLNNNDQETLRSVGLAHLLAISGLHMGLAAGIFFYIIKTLLTFIEFVAIRVYVSKIAAIGAIFGATGYLLLSGASIATQRAYIMALISLIAILLDRPALSLRNVSVAMILVVAIKPETVVSPGFQMSFAATAALIALYEAWPKGANNSVGSRISKWASSIFATSLIASLATAPFSAFHFGRIAPMSVVSNLAAMPLISFWSAPSAAMAAIVSPLGLEDWFLRSFGYSLELVLMISRYFQSISPDGGNIYIPSMVFLMSILALVLGVILTRWYKILAVLPIIFAVTHFLTSPRPILLIDRAGIIYANSEKNWTRVLPEHSGRKPLKPLSLKDHLTDYHSKYSVSITISEEVHWGNWKISPEPCGQNENISSNYLRISTSKENLCMHLTEQIYSKGIQILQTRDGLSYKTFKKGFNAERAWTD